MRRRMEILIEKENSGVEQGNTRRMGVKGRMEEASAPNFCRPAGARRLNRVMFSVRASAPS